MNAPHWLVARPIAHRGLHGLPSGAIENSLSAASAALLQGYAIECDVQVTADGDAVVFHDDTLDRLTARTGAVARMTAETLTGIALIGSTEKVAPFAALLALVAGRVPLICEIKSRFDGDLRLADRVAETLSGYPGPVAVKSFDPAVLARLRALNLPRPIGIVAEAGFEGPEWRHLTPQTRRGLANVLHFSATRPDFLSFKAADLPHAVPTLFRAGLGLPVMAWTVRSEDARRSAESWADGFIFEGFLP